MSIIAEIRAEMGRQNLKNIDIARKINSSRQHVSQRLNNDKGLISNYELERYAKALHIPASELVRRAEEAEERKAQK